MNKPTKKVSSRPPGPFDFCPKHNVFYASCGCTPKGASKKTSAEEKDEE